MADSPLFYTHAHGGPKSEFALAMMEVGIRCCTDGFYRPERELGLPGLKFRETSRHGR